MTDIDHNVVDTIQTRTDFARELSALRFRAGLSVRALARELDTPPGTLGDYFGGRHVPSPAQVPLFRRLLDKCGVTEPVEVERWLDALTRVRTTSDGRTARPPAPYRGLEPFQPEDAGLFFGREALTAEVVARLTKLRDDPGPSHGMLAVTGPSGSGKSSLLRAGLVPAVRAGALAEDGTTWECTVLTPGTTPTEDVGRVIGGEPGVRRVIVLDQFEEVFTSVDDDERRAFIEALAAADAQFTLVVLGIRADFYAQATREPEILAVLQHAQVLVGPMSEPEVRSAIVEPARRSDVAVEDGLVDLLVADLSARGLAGQAYDAGALPLLSYALLATWERATRNQLTIADYRATGGINGAIRQTAEELFDELAPTEQQLVQRIFLRLVNVDEEMQATRRRVRREELDELSVHLHDGGRAEDVLHRYVERRLITLHADTAEVSHEALLSAWPRLRDWIDTDVADLRLHRQLTDAANAWQEAARDEALLLRGGRLEVATEWAATRDHRSALNRTEAHFLEASTTATTAERDAARRRARRLQGLVAALAVLVVVAGLLTGYAFVSRAEANRQTAAAETARDQALSRQVAIESVRLRDTDPALATQLALAAYRIYPTADARSVLLDTSAQRSATRVLGASGPTALAVSPDGKLVAVGHADDGSARLYQVNGDGMPALLAALPGQGSAAQVYAIAFSPDGHLLATGDQSGGVRLWDVSTPASPKALGGELTPGFGAGVLALTFSPDGKALLAGGAKPAVHRWDVTDPHSPRSLPAPAGVPATITVQSLAYSPDGKLLAAAGTDSTVLLWATPDAAKTPARMSTTSATATSLAFDPKTPRLAVGGKDGAVLVWDISHPARPRPVTGPTTGLTTWVNTVAFSPDGASLAVGSSDNTLTAWDTASWSKRYTMPHPGPVTGTAYLPDGSAVASTAADGSLRLWPTGEASAPVNGSVFGLVYNGDGSRLVIGTTGKNGRAALWDTTTRTRPRSLGPDLIPSDAFGHDDGTAALTTDGKTVAVGNSTGGVQLWDVTDPAHSKPYEPSVQGAAALVEALAFSPDQKLLGVAADDNAVHLWDVSDVTHPKSLAKLTVKSLALGVVFSPNSSLMAGTVADNTTHLWDVSNPADPKELAVLTGFKNYAWAPAFSPDGRTLAVTSADHTTRLWNITDPAHPKALGGPITGPTDYAESASFTPDGKTLAVGSGDHTVWLYDIHDPEHPAVLATLRALPASVYSLTYSPNGQMLAGAGGDSTARFWDVEPARVARDICRTQGDSITRAEWAQYIPGKAYTPPCR